MDVCRKTTNMLGISTEQRNNNKDHQEYNLMINFEETELRLGLPGGGGSTSTTTTTTGGDGGGEMTPSAKNNSGKRGFSETIDLELNLESKHQDRSEITTDLLIHSSTTEKKTNINKNLSSSSSFISSSSSSKEKNHLPPCSNDPEKPSASKAQVVGWPPVRSFRKNILTVNQKSNADEEKGNIGAAFVKVSMDGAPYLRKVDLKMYKSYQDLSDALGKMFSSFTIGNCGSQGMKDFMNESKLMDLLNSTEYVPTYEDKDGDWMLVGDVPWPMFVDSCKRLRIMKGSEAIGLAPRAVEKCKNRS